jgi:hypothetical protein
MWIAICRNEKETSARERRFAREMADVMLYHSGSRKKLEMKRKCHILHISFYFQHLGNVVDSLHGDY